MITNKRVLSFNVTFNIFFKQFIEIVTKSWENYNYITLKTNKTNKLESK